VRDYSTFNFGKSYYRDVPVLELIKEKLPVSISLGMWMTSFPTRFRFRLASGRRSRTAPVLTRHVRARDLRLRHSELSVACCSLCCLRRIVLADLPAAGLTSDNFADLSWPQKILDYLWHIALPVTALVLARSRPRRC